MALSEVHSEVFLSVTEETDNFLSLQEEDTLYLPIEQVNTMFIASLVTQENSRL